MPHRSRLSRRSRPPHTSRTLQLPRSPRRRQTQNNKRCTESDLPTFSNIGWSSVWQAPRCELCVSSIAAVVGAVTRHDNKNINDVNYKNIWRRESRHIHDSSISNVVSTKQALLCPRRNSKNEEIVELINDWNYCLALYGTYKLNRNLKTLQNWRVEFGSARWLKIQNESNSITWTITQTTRP